MIVNLFRISSYPSSVSIVSSSDNISQQKYIVSSTFLKMKKVVCISLLLCFGSISSNPVHVNSSLDNSFALVGNVDNVQHARIGSKKCMKDLGCFEITPDFYHPLNRPLNLLPHDRQTINTRFNLYTKLHPKEHHPLDASDHEEILESPFDSTHQTKFIVHGFFDSTLYGKWMESLKDNLLLEGDYNVIIVDWSKGNGAPYTQATANTRVVGAEIAFLIQTLQKLFGISPMDCHIVGHSLGSHIAGYAGERLKKLGRITAVDPAQPYFQNMPPTVRIDRMDADFVDVIHTDSSSTKFLALGMSQAIGHVDFYPNNGMSQPGCTYSSIYSIFLEGLVDAARQFVSCNHQRAVDYFTYSINFRKALPVGYQCKSYQDYLDGHCSDCGRDGKKCAVMGMRAADYKPFKNDSESIKMYLSTSGKAPFWVYSYQITVKLSKPNTSFKDRTGDIKLQIHGSRNDYEVTVATKKKELIHGATYSFLIAKDEQLGDVKGMTFSWTSGSWSIFTTHTIYLDYVKITPMNTIEKDKREKNTKKFCNKNKKPIASKAKQLLNECS